MKRAVQTSSVPLGQSLSNIPVEKVFVQSDTSKVPTGATPQDHTPATKRRIGRSVLLLGIKLGIGVLLLSIVLWQVNLAHVSAILASCRPLDVALAFLCLTVSVLVNAHRWCRVAAGIGRPISLRTSAIGYFESMLFNQVLPTSVGGDASRVLRAIDAGIGYGWAICGVLIDRALGLWAVAFCLATSYFVAGAGLNHTPAFLILSAASAVILAGSVVAAVAGEWLKPSHLPVWASAAVTLTNGFRRCVAIPGVFVLLVDLALTTGLVVTSFALCARALGLQLGWIDATIIVQGVTLASILPASIGGWGLREGAAVILMAPLGFDASQATALSVLFGLIITALGLVGAFVWIVSSYRRRSRAAGRRVLSLRALWSA